MGRLKIIISALTITGTLIACSITTPAGLINDKLIISSMFPGKQFVKQGDLFVNELTERDSYYIEEVKEGSFTKSEAKQYLIVVRRPQEELSHSGGLYNSYVAVYDESTNRKISGIHLFAADEGHISLFRSKGLDYVFFAGGTTYQGWTNWDGGLWRAGDKWEKVWPEPKINDYWEDKYPEANSEGLKIMERKTTQVPGQVIPDYHWNYAYSLKWNPEKLSFD